MTGSSGRPLGEPERLPDSPQGPWTGPHPPGGYGTTPQAYPGFTPPPAGRGNGLAAGSLVVGLVALVAALTLFGGAILGIAAVMMGFVARRRVKRGEATGGGVALAGIVVGFIATVASLLIIWLALGTGLFNEDYQHCLGEHNGMAQYCEQYR